jgi:hypothetical protein
MSIPGADAKDILSPGEEVQDKNDRDEWGRTWGNLRCLGADRKALGGHFRYKPFHNDANRWMGVELLPVLKSKRKFR